MLVQSLSDKFEDIVLDDTALILARPGSVLSKGNKKPKLSPEQHSSYQVEVGIYLAKFDLSLKCTSFVHVYMEHAPSHIMITRPSI